jgi:PAS domain S-box-containing protein
MQQHSSEMLLKELTEQNVQLKKENEELYKSHKELKTLFESIDEVLYSVDMVSFEVLQITAACEKVTGYSCEEFLADPDLWKKIVHPEDKDISKQQVQLLSQGKQVLNQYRIIHKTKSIRWIENKITPTLDKTGRLIRIDAVTNDITERKIAEKKLEESVSVLEATIESTADGILVIDFEGKIVRFNKKFAELWRMPLEILETMDNEKAIAYVSDQMENPAEFVSKTKELHSKQKETSFGIHKFKDGRIFQRYSQPQLINGNCVGRVISFRDITEQKKAEKALREGEKRLRQIIDLVPHFIFAKDTEGKFTLVNEAVAKAYGSTVEDLVGKGDADFNSNTKEVEHFIQEDLAVTRNGTAKYNIEETVTDADGNTRILSTTKIPFNSQLGQGLLGVSVDISERKKAENKVKESELRYRSLIEQATDAICIADASMKIMDINPSGCKMLGYSKEEFLLLSVFDLFLVEDLKANPFKIDELKSGKIIQNERRFKRKDGTTVEVGISGKILEDGRFIVFGSDISERKKAENKVKESELRYRSLIEQATDAICIADASLKFIDMNPYACDFLGYTKEEALQLFVTDVIFPEDLATNPINKFDTIKTKEIVRNERRFKRKDGTSVIMEVSTQLMEDGRFIMYGHDISERKKAETILKENEGRLSIATKIAKLGYWELDLIKGLFTFNDQFYSIFKTTAEREGGYTMTPENYSRKFVHPDDKSIVSMEVANAINSLDANYTRNLEHRIIYATGEIGWISVNLYLVKNDEGRTIKTFGANQDITDRKNAEAEIRRSEERYRQIVETAQEGIWLVDENNKGSFVNKRLCEMLGYTAEEMIGKEVFHFLDDEGKKIARESIEKRKQGGSDTLTFKFITKQGALLWTYISYSSVLDDNGTYMGTLAMITDITQRKLHEELLEKSEANLELKNKQLEQKNKELEQFAYVASHDMQEPLRTTSSFVELLQQQYKGKLDEKADKYLTFIAESSDRMKVLIKDLLDYSRIGKKKELAEVDCNIMLKEVLADLGAAINEAGAEITIEQLPVVNGYPTEIKQLFQNLIINAIKFRQKSIPSAIKISAQKKQGHWEFAFADNGIGIAKEHTERIFIIFQRLHTRNEYDGSGIGLSHCKKIVELHKGRIWVESTPGKGSTFHFTISKTNN